MRPSGPGVAVTNCAFGAAFAYLAGSVAPMNSKARKNKMIMKNGRIFIGADYNIRLFDQQLNCWTNNYFPYLFLISGKKYSSKNASAS